MTLFNQLSPHAKSQLIKERLLRRAQERRTHRRDVSKFDDPVDWIQKNFYIPETNGPMALYPSQIEPLREALRLDENGRFVYSTICWSAIKKSAKSSIAAAVGMWFAFQNPWSSVKIVANSLRQASSRSYYYCTRAIQLNPDWSGIVKVSKNVISLPNGSTITAVPLNPDTEAGGGDDFVMYTEIWAWRHQSALRMWTETTLSPLMYGKSLRWAEGYAGRIGESPVLEGLYQSGVNEGELINEQYGMYSNKSARLFCLWQKRPFLPWQTKEYYAQEAATLTDGEFRRVHRNEWVSSKDVFVPAEWWAACQDHVPRRDGEYWVVAMDAAVSGDSFGVIAVSLHPSLKDHVVVRYARAWYPPKGGKLDFQGTEENPGPEREVIRLCKQYNVAQVAYDPYQLEDMANRLRKKGIAWFFPFSQGAMRLKADSDLRQMIRDRRIHHSGEPRLKEHVENSGAEINKDDNKIRIVKLSQEKKVDLCVALSMSADRALYLNL